MRELSKSKILRSLIAYNLQFEEAETYVHWQCPEEAPLLIVPCPRDFSTRQLIPSVRPCNNDHADNQRSQEKLHTMLPEKCRGDSDYYRNGRCKLTITWMFFASIPMLAHFYANNYPMKLNHARAHHQCQRIILCQIFLTSTDPCTLSYLLSRHFGQDNVYIKVATNHFMELW